MLLRMKFLLLAGILAATTAPAVDAKSVAPHSWISPTALGRAKSGAVLFVSDFSNHVVDMYDANNPKKQIGQIAGLLSLPETLAVDKSGNLYVYDGRPNQVIEFKPPYTGGPVKEFYGFYGPVLGMSVDSHGTLYVAAQDNQVFEFAKGHTKGKGIALPVAPTGVTLDASGNLICAYNAGGAAGVLQLTSASPIPKNLLIPLEQSAGDVLYDGSGNLVVGSVDGHYINVYPPGATKPSKTIDRGFVNPVHMAFSADKSLLYVVDYGNNTVKAITYPSGKLQWQLGGFGQSWGVAVSPAALP